MPRDTAEGLDAGRTAGFGAAVGVDVGVGVGVVFRCLLPWLLLLPLAVVYVGYCVCVDGDGELLGCARWLLPCTIAAFPEPVSATNPAMTSRPVRAPIRRARIPHLTRRSSADYSPDLSRFRRKCRHGVNSAPTTRSASPARPCAARSAGRTSAVPTRASPRSPSGRRQKRRHHNERSTSQ